MTQEYRERTSKEIYHDLQKVIDFLAQVPSDDKRKGYAGFLMATVIEARKFLKGEA